MQAKSGQPPRKKPGRVSLPPVVAPPKGSPFTGISGTKAPARNTNIPNLTEHVQVAKSKVQALQNAGLHTEAEREATTAAQTILANSKPLPRAFPTTKSGGKTPPAPSKLPARLSQPAVSLDQTPPSAPAPASSIRLPTGSRGALSPRAGMAAAEAAKPKGQLLGAIGDAAGALKSDVSKSLHDPLSNLLPAAPVTAPILRHFGINVTSGAAKGGTKAAGEIQQAGSKQGVIPTSLLTDSQAAQFRGQQTVTEQQIRDLEAQKGGLGGLPQEARNTLIEGAVKNGWPRWMAVKSVDSDLIHLYGNKPSNPIIQFAKNVGSFAATQAGAPAGFVAVGDAAVQAAKGDTTPLAKQAQQFVEGSMVGLPGIGPHPTLQSWYWQPGESAQNLSLVLGAADRAAGAASKFAPGVERSITPEGFTAPVSRGTYSTRPLQRGIEKARDAYVRSDPNGPFSVPGVGPKSRRTAIAKDAYQATRERAVAPVMLQSAKLRADVMRTANAVGNERANALNAYLKGSDPADRAAFYEQVSRELGPAKGRGAAAHAKLSAKHPVSEATLTPKDRAYVDAVRAAATFSTETRAGAGQLTADLSGRYRAYHEPIVIAAKKGDELATRTQFLHDEWTKALAKKADPETLGTIADQFGSALDDFTARHAEQGGTTPVYIPEVVPQTLKNAFRREPSVTATSKVPKLKATKDTLVSTGQFRGTPADVSLEAHRAAVVRARIDHFKAVEEEYATKAPNGEPADPNVVYVKADNLRAPVKLENTVDEHNLTDDQVHSTLDQMRMALEGGKVDVTGGYIPQHGDIRAIPKTIYDELHASTTLPKGAPVGIAYDKANRAYQRFMLSKPSTGISNIVGNPILATIGGASPLDNVRGYGIVKNRPETIPPTLLSGEGLAGAAGQKIARTPIGKYVNFSLSHQRASEDAARAALYHHKVGPYVRGQMEKTGRSADEILHDLATGKDVNGTRFVKEVEDFLGTMRPSKKLDPGTEKMLSRGILFHRWLGHILTLSLYTMPVKYPGRAVFLQRVSEIGDDYRKHHGVFPSWYLSMIPLMQHIATGAGVPESFTRVLPTSTIWPTANLPIPLSDAEGANPWSAAIGSANPVVRSLAEAPTGMNFSNLRPYKDAKGNDIGPGLNLDLLAGQEYRAVPYAGVLTPFAGQGDTSYPGNFNMRVNKNKYGKPLPPGFGTSSIPYGGNKPALTPEYGLGLLSRLLLGGSGIQDLPAQTRGTNYSRTKQLVTARKGHNKIIRERAQARAKKKP